MKKKPPKSATKKEVEVGSSTAPGNNAAILGSMAMLAQMPPSRCRMVGPGADVGNSVFEALPCKNGQADVDRVTGLIDSGAIRVGYTVGPGPNARHTLLQFSFFGLLEERCLTEKLFEAQFGLRFNRSAAKGAARVGTHDGKGAHRVTKLAFGDLTPAQQQRVRWLNRNDLWLYGQAVRIFYERLRLYGISPDATCA